MGKRVVAMVPAAKRKKVWNTQVLTFKAVSKFICYV